MARTTRRKPAPDPHHELVELARDLDLTALAENFPELLRRAQDETSSFTDFALDLLRTERDARVERLLQRILKRARLGVVEGLQGFDFAARPRLDARVVKDLQHGHFVEEHRNVLCLGKPGLGKTRVAKAIVHSACLAGHSALCVLTADMLEDLHSSRADATFNRALRRYVKPATLLLDEFGYQPFDLQDTNYLFRVVSARHEHGSIVLTANCGFSRWKDLFPSEAMAVATVDRLVDRATILRFTGKSFRQPLEVHGAPLEE
jgi:DNA replication protein DnaC